MDLKGVTYLIPFVLFLGLWIVFFRYLRGAPAGSAAARRRRRGLAACALVLSLTLLLLAALARDPLPAILGGLGAALGAAGLLRKRPPWRRHHA